MGVFAEFERAMIAERVRAGMVRARANGTRSGKPIGRPRIKSETEQAIRVLLPWREGDLQHRSRRWRWCSDGAADQVRARQSLGSRSPHIAVYSLAGHLDEPV